MSFNLPHRRYNPLTQEWVLVSPHRTQRPWLGQVEKSPLEDLPAYDPDCYLCPGNPRAGGKKNSDYASTYIFDNDYPALLAPSPDRAAYNDPAAGETQPHDGLLVARPEFGICRVVCFSPRHDLSLPELSRPEVETVIRTWTEQTLDLESREWVEYVQVFENKGAMMGASNPHPHSQIWASSLVPDEPAKEMAGQTAYRHTYGACLLCDYLRTEKQNGERVVEANEHFTALVPFWGVWPFETLLVSNRHLSRLADMDEREISGLAEIMQKLTARYDNLFEVSFPYSMGFHQKPAHQSPDGTWHLHAHYFPPLLRSATVRKFMVGYEMLAMPQRDLTPEMAAERLRSLSAHHYRSPLREG